MSYIGPRDITTRVAWSDVYNIPEYSAQTITGSGAFVYALDSTPTGVNSIEVSIDGVTQVPTTDYVVDADVPNVSFTTALNSGEKNGALRARKNGALVPSHFSRVPMS